MCLSALARECGHVCEGRAGAISARLMFTSELSTLEACEKHPQTHTDGVLAMEYQWAEGHMAVREFSYRLTAEGTRV